LAFVTEENRASYRELEPDVGKVTRTSKGSSMTTNHPAKICFDMSGLVALPCGIWDISESGARMSADPFPSDLPRIGHGMLAAAYSA
jgi:hypothetical protein